MEKHNRALFNLYDEDDGMLMCCASVHALLVLACEDVNVQRWRKQPQFGVNHLKDVGAPGWVPEPAKRYDESMESVMSH